MSSRVEVFQFIKLNRILVLLSCVSLLWSTSTCMVISIFPTFITEELGFNKIYFGWMEGTAIALAFVARICSGVLSDYLKQRKLLLLVGTFLSIICKVLFVFVSSAFSVFMLRSFDRFAKGIRSAPMDALIADLSHQNIQGKSYGLRQSLYTLGAVLGSLLASYLLYVFECNYRFVFLCSVIPVLLSFIIIFLYVHDIHHELPVSKKYSWNIEDIKKLPLSFWQVIAVSFLLMLGHFSDSFLSLKAREIGFSVYALPLLIMVYDLANVFIAFPIGVLADKKNRYTILWIGIFFLMLADMCMAFSDHYVLIVLGYIFAGVHMGMTHGLLSTLIAQNALSHLKGTAFSIYYFSTGVAIFISNPLSGYVSTIFNTASAPFYSGLFFASCSFLLLSYFQIQNRLSK